MWPANRRYTYAAVLTPTNICIYVRPRHRNDIITLVCRNNGGNGY